jgi:hypothetical protein
VDTDLLTALSPIKGQHSLSAGIDTGAAEDTFRMLHPPQEKDTDKKQHQHDKAAVDDILGTRLTRKIPIIVAI